MTATINDTPTATPVEPEPEPLAVALGDTRGIARTLLCLKLARTRSDARRRVWKRVYQDVESVAVFLRASHAKYRATTIYTARAVVVCVILCALRWGLPTAVAISVAAYVLTVPLRWHVRAVFRRQCRYSEKARKTELEFGTIHTADYRDNKIVAGDNNAAASHRQQVPRHRTVLVPTIRSVKRTPSGWKATLVMPRGQTVDYFAKWAHTVAAHMWHRVSVKADHDDRGEGAVSIVRMDPLRGPGLAHPSLMAQTDFWEPCPIGIDENGDDVSWPMSEDRVLIGGVPRSGKSVMATNILIHAACDPRVPLFIIDPKGVDYAVFEQCIEASGVGAYTRGQTPGDVLRVLRAAAAEMKRREDWMHDQYRLEGKLKRYIGAGDPFAPALFLMDEWARMRDDMGKQVHVFDGLLYKLLSSGPASAIGMVDITQDPRWEATPVKHRNLHTKRAAHLVIGDRMSDIVLGDGTAEELGRSAFREIDATQKGVALALDGGDFVKMRSYYVRDEPLMEVAAFAAQLRREAVAQGFGGPLWGAESSGGSQEDGGVDVKGGVLDGGGGSGGGSGNGKVGVVGTEGSDGAMRYRFDGSNGNGNGRGPKPGRRPSDGR